MLYQIFHISVNNAHFKPTDKFWLFFLILSTPALQNGQTQSNNFLNCLSVFDHFVGLALQGLIKRLILEFLNTFQRFCANANFTPIILNKKIHVKKRSQIMILVPLR